MKEIKMLELVFEVTRKCNLRCDGFCMRGESQKITLDNEIIKKVFDPKNKISYIHNLVLSGGEPTLEPDVIDFIIDCIIENKIRVNLLRIVTNGQIFSQKIIDSLNKFDSYMKNIDKADRKYYIILFSVDEYHSPIPNHVKTKYMENEIDCNKNKIFSEGEMNVIKTGLNNQIGREFTYKCEPVRFFLKDKSFFLIDELYICANGNVTSNGMGAYIDMDKNNFCDVMDVCVYDIIINNSNLIELNSSIYNKLLNFIFEEWYDVFINKDFSHKVNLNLINFFQKICINKGKGFSKGEVKKLNKYENKLDRETLKNEYDNLNIELKEKYFKMLMELNLDEDTIMSLTAYLCTNNFDFSLFYNYIRNIDYINNEKEFIKLR